MEQFTFIIKDELGIHARPAGLLVKETSNFKSSIELRIGERAAAANRLFSVMGLCAKQGDELIVTIEGEDEQEASVTIQKFFKENL